MLYMFCLAMEKSGRSIARPFDLKHPVWAEMQRLSMLGRGRRPDGLCEALGQQWISGIFRAGEGRLIYRESRIS
jgi:hypothetical protein